MELLLLAPETKNYHCPFNPSHSMPHKTLIKHLTRCPDKPAHFASCMYNISHVMPQSEIKHHQENCPNRILIDNAVYESADIRRPVPVILNVPIIDYEESWDDLEQSDVLRNINQKTILMKAKHNETKSERKKYRVSLHEHDIESNINPSQRKKSALTCQQKQQIENNVKSKQSKKEKKMFIGMRP